MKYFSVLIFIGSLLFISCSENSSGSERGTFDAIIDGTITDITGNTVNNASVLILSHSLACDNMQEDGISHGVINSGPEGTFSDRLQSLTKDTIRCLSFEVRPSNESALPDTTFTVTTILELKADQPFNEESVELSY